jgi:tetratricopeptide (TPR) repeat protein
MMRIALCTLVFVGLIVALACGTRSARRRALLLLTVVALIIYWIAKPIQWLWRKATTGLVGMAVGLLLTGGVVIVVRVLASRYAERLVRHPHLHDVAIAMQSPPASQDFWTGIFAQVLMLYCLLVVLWTRRLLARPLMVEEFSDFTSADTASQIAVKGLATKLVTQLARLRDLYDDVDEQRAISSDPGVHRVLNPTMRVDELSGSFSAISAETKISFGPFAVPIGAILSIIGKAFRSHRITASVHGTADHILFTARYEGPDRTYTWRVDSQTWIGEPDAEGARSVDDLVDELACRIFADLALSGTVRWRAAWGFTCGLREYRKCLRSQRDRAAHLRAAESRFIEALADDSAFSLVYYDLGVVYTELDQPSAAEVAFGRAAQGNPRLWSPLYALGLNRLQKLRATTYSPTIPAADPGLRMKYEEIVILCKRARRLRPSRAMRAKAWDLQGSTYLDLAVSGSPKQPGVGGTASPRNQEDWHDCHHAHTRACFASVLALIKALFRKGGNRDPFGDRHERARELASACVANLGRVHMARAVLVPHKYGASARTAKLLFRVSARIDRSSVACRLDLGRACHLLSQRHQARRHYKTAIGMDPESPQHRSYLAVLLADEPEFEGSWTEFLDRATALSAPALRRLLDGTRDIAGRSCPAVARLEQVVGLLYEFGKDPRASERQQCLDRMANLHGGHDDRWCRGVLWAAAGRLGFIADADDKAIADFDRAINELAPYPSTLAQLDIGAQRAYCLARLLATQQMAIGQSRQTIIATQKKLKKALAGKECVVASNPMGSESYHLLGAVLFQMGDYDGLHTAIEAGLLWSPDDNRIRLNHAEAHRQLAARTADPGKWRSEMCTAVKIYEQALLDFGHRRPQSKAMAHVRLGRVLYAMNDMRSAAVHFRQAKVLGPAGNEDLQWRAMLGLAAALRGSGRLDDATMELTRLIEILDREERSSWCSAEKVDQDFGVSDEPVYRQELNIIAHCQLALVHLDRGGDWTQAEREFWYANVRLESPLAADAQVRCVAACTEVEGRLRLAQGQRDAAIERLRYSVRLRGSAEAYVWLAKAYAQTSGADEDVRLAAAQAIRLDPAGRYMQLLAELKGSAQSRSPGCSPA